MQAFGRDTAPSRQDLEGGSCPCARAHLTPMVDVSSGPEKGGENEGLQGAIGSPSGPPSGAATGSGAGVGAVVVSSLAAEVAGTPPRPIRSFS